MRHQGLLLKGKAPLIKTTNNLKTSFLLSVSKGLLVCGMSGQIMRKRVSVGWRVKKCHKSDSERVEVMGTQSSVSPLMTDAGNTTSFSQSLILLNTTETVGCIMKEQHCPVSV